MQQSHQWYRSTTGTTETTTSNELQSCHSRPFPWPWSCQPWEGETVPSTCKISIHLTRRGFLINFCQCKTCCKVTYLTQPIGKIILNSYKNFPLLKLCKDKLATTPHMSQPVPDANGSNSSVIYRKFLIKYYEYSFDYLIIIMNQLRLTCYLVYRTVCFPYRTQTYGTY